MFELVASVQLKGQLSQMFCQQFCFSCNQTKRTVKDSCGNRSEVNAVNRDQISAHRWAEHKICNTAVCMHMDLTHEYILLCVLFLPLLLRRRCRCRCRVHVSFRFFLFGRPIAFVLLIRPHSPQSGFGGQYTLVVHAYSSSTAAANGTHTHITPSLEQEKQNK